MTDADGKPPPVPRAGEFSRRLPTWRERQEAVSLSETFRMHMEGDGRVEISIDRGEGSPADELEFEPALAEAVCALADAIAGGSGVMLVPFHREMSIGMASDILNVDENFVRKLGESGEIGITRPGMRPRVDSESVFAYRERRDAKREKALDSLMAEDPGV